MIKLNCKLIDDPEKAYEVLMMITAALFTGMDKHTPLQEANEIAGLCASMWRVCDALSEMAGGEQA